MDNFRQNVSSIGTAVKAGWTLFNNVKQEAAPLIKLAGRVANYEKDPLYQEVNQGVQAVKRIKDKVSKKSKRQKTQ